MREQVRADNLTICYREKQIEVSFSCVCPVIDNEFRHDIVKEVCGDNSKTDAWKTDVNFLVQTWTAYDTFTFIIAFRRFF